MQDVRNEIFDSKEDFNIVVEILKKTLSPEKADCIIKSMEKAMRTKEEEQLMDELPQDWREFEISMKEETRKRGRRQREEDEDDDTESQT